MERKTKEKEEEKMNGKIILSIIIILLLGGGIFWVVHSLSSDTKLQEIFIKLETKISYGNSTFPDDYKEIEIPENIKADYDRCYDEIEDVSQSIMICYKVNGFMDVTFSAFPVQYYVEDDSHKV